MALQTKQCDLQAMHAIELLQEADVIPKTGAQLCVIAEPAQKNSWQP